MGKINNKLNESNQNIPTDRKTIHTVGVDTQRTLYEIEVALAKTDKFNYIKNVIAFNVNGLGYSLFINHECDMLVLSKSGYLTEIEIKRSWSDFKADFKKKHSHESADLIKSFYYCIPLSILDKVKEYFKDKKMYSSNVVITYDEDLNIEFHQIECNGIEHNSKYRKLFLEEQFQVARFGAMRAINIKEKINRLINNT